MSSAQVFAGVKASHPFRTPLFPVPRQHYRSDARASASRGGRAGRLGAPQQDGVNGQTPTARPPGAPCAAKMPTPPAYPDDLSRIDGCPSPTACCLRHSADFGRGNRRSDAAASDVVSARRPLGPSRTARLRRWDDLRPEGLAT